MYVPDSLSALRGAPARYDRVASAYDLLHRYWLWRAGAQAIAAIEGAIAAELKPDIEVLDAGCGTGMLSRRIQAIEPRCRITMVDAAPRMLARTTDVAGDRRLADLSALPIEDARFSIVVSSWVLETMGQSRAAALTELHRVLKPGGLLCYSVCSWPTSRLRRAISWPMRFTVEQLFHGAFLKPHEIHAPTPGEARRLSFHGGLSTVLVYRKAAGGMAC
jgi:ubiquinone/menaquinone biosynthesis C-methylase UbiE